MNQKSYYRLRVLAGMLFIVALMPVHLYAQEEENFEVTIEEPRDGLEVGLIVTVKGTATIPSGTHIWVLARRVDFDGFWWPQGEGRINPTTQKWRATATLGEPQDVGWDFDIAVIVVDEENHIKLGDYRRNAMRTGDWRPIEAPPTVTPPLIRTLTKVSHN